jgi:hypothetical protein
MVAAGSRDSPKSITLLNQRILPRMQRRPVLIMDFLKSTNPVEVRDEGGVPIGRAFSVDHRRVQVVIDKIVRGLFFKHTNRRLADNFSVEEFIYRPEIEIPLQNTIIQLPLHNIGDGSVFSYRFVIGGKKSSESFWFLMFYNDTSLFIARTSQSKK